MTKPGYADIETQVGEQLKSRAILELYEHYLELMPILTCRSESLGLVLYDANGYLLLPKAGNTLTKKPKTKLRHTGGNAKPKNGSGGRKTDGCRRASKTSTNTSAPKWTN